MRNYEAVIVVDLSHGGEQKEAFASSLKSLFEKNEAKIVKTISMGKKRLAFEIKKNKEAIYWLYQFQAEPSSISNIKRALRLMDVVLTSIIVQEDTFTQEDVFLAKNDRK